MSLTHRKMRPARLLYRKFSAFTRFQQSTECQSALKTSQLTNPSKRVLRCTGFPIQSVAPHSQDGASCVGYSAKGQMFNVNFVGSRILELLKKRVYGIIDWVDEISREFESQPKRC